ncbi:MAG TPA: bifunctional riboflavin kinase/FAD synthetase [Syntrophorhabdaceae bacterium]|nr:bifunctional riboflavin kinase/FAD synthetase [Syntrophorhabdaceae bacterium]
MKIFESLSNIEKFPNPVLTIGNYDGIHIGHQEIIRRVVAKAKEMSGTPMLMTFNPHPLSVLKPDSYIRLITPLHLKKKLIKSLGIEVMLILPFDTQFQDLPPEMFVQRVLSEKIGVKWIYVGYDFKFGKNGKGTVDTLKDLSKVYNFESDVVQAIQINGERVGSNAIRKLIMEGDVEKAGQFLGRPHMIEGTVVKGENRGKHMGFPTINLDTFFELVPKNGVYVTEVELKGKSKPAVTNIGYNPTFGGKKFLMETHILDFSGNLYGKEVMIYFHKRIRQEMKFSGMEELKQRIAGDIATAREYFQNNGSLKP